MSTEEAIVCGVCGLPRPTLRCTLCGQPMCDTAACAERRGDEIVCITCVDAMPRYEDKLASIRQSLQEARDHVEHLREELESAHGDVYDLEKELAAARKSIGR